MHYCRSQNPRVQPSEVAATERQRRHPLRLRAGELGRARRGRRRRRGSRPRARTRRLIGCRPRRGVLSECSRRTGAGQLYGCACAPRRRLLRQGCGGEQCGAWGSLRLSWATVGPPVSLHARIRTKTNIINSPQNQKIKKTRSHSILPPPFRRARNFSICFVIRNQRCRVWSLS